MNKALLFLGLFFMLACKSSYVTVQVMKPAQITVPSGIQSFIIINRTRPAKEERAKNIIEGVLTGEAPFADRHGAEECVKGLANGLNDSPRFKAFLPDGLDFRGTGTREFPIPLDWDFAADLCAKNNVDGILSLETFDSNNHIEIREHQVEKKDKDKVIKYIEYKAELNVQIDAGWRIYYPAQKSIVDQKVFMDHQQWFNTNDTRKKAELGLPGMDRAVSEAGYYAGNQYAIRISPRWVNVSRSFYKKGPADFETAARKIKINDWKGAAELWEKHTKSQDSKIAGYACFNMALACEMDGNLEAALDWVKKAYSDYNLSSAKYYISVIQQRIQDQYRLDEQMNSVQ